LVFGPCGRKRMEMHRNEERWSVCGQRHRHRRGIPTLAALKRQTLYHTAFLNCKHGLRNWRNMGSRTKVSQPDRSPRLRATGSGVRAAQTWEPGNASERPDLHIAVK
jgi:hypothetical protein